MAETEIKLTRGVPDPESFPAADLADCACTVLENEAAIVLQYGAAGGYPPLRARLAQDTGISEGRILIGQGSLQILDFVTRVLLPPGSLVYTEKPTYDRALTVLKRAGTHVTGIPMQDDGLDIDFLEVQLASGDRPSLLYTIPDFQNPSGTVLSLEKRQRLADLARQYGFWLVEDIPYRRLRYRGEDVSTLLELAPGQVMQMSSYSKLIAPGLRVGYAILPEEAAPRLLKFVEDTYISPTYVAQAMVNEYIRRGSLAANIGRLKELYAPRLDAMLSALEECMQALGHWHAPEGGFFVGLTLHRPIPAPELLARARAAGLLLTDGRGFFTGGGGDSFIRLPFCALSSDQIQEGIRRLAGVIRSFAA